MTYRFKIHGNPLAESGWMATANRAFQDAHYKAYQENRRSVNAHEFLGVTCPDVQRAFCEKFKAEVAVLECGPKISDDQDNIDHEEQDPDQEDPDQEDPGTS